MPLTRHQQRRLLADLVVVTASWILIDRLGPHLRLGWLPYVFIWIAWGVGLGVFRPRGKMKERSFGRLVSDHCLIAVAWALTLNFCGVRVDAFDVLCFALIAIPGFAIVHAEPWLSSVRGRFKAATAPLANTMMETRGAYYSPRALFVGILAGFAAMCIMGLLAARLRYHEHFTRFTEWIAPETRYYPTILEAENLVRQNAPPGKILVIVGGNSILYGLGQPAGHVWTDYLQRALGSDYAVVNLAFRGSGSNDGGAVVAEALRREFPRQIYIANEWPTEFPPAAGGFFFRFMYWDAYYKGLLIDDPARIAAIASDREDAAFWAATTELKTRMLLDRFFHFQDFWNYIAYSKFGTVWGAYDPGPTIQFLQPRNIRPDAEADYTVYTTSHRFPPYKDAAELALMPIWDIRAFGPSRGKDGKWHANAAMWDDFTRGIDGAFPQELKRRTLILMCRNCPYYVEKLSPDAREREELATVFAVQKWRQGGYEALDFAKNFTVDDYGDRIHLTWPGGVKLAQSVASKVREMSAQLGYLRP